MIKIKRERLNSIVAACLAAALGAYGSSALAGAQKTSHLEPWRPQLSFSPAKNWMNDPNGLVYYAGDYHLFFQYNPSGNNWGNISWGHAVSKDLVHWTELPVALPVELDQNGNPTQMFFSGSAVVDFNNTSGFGTTSNPAMVAIFTSFYPQTLTLPNGQVVQAGTQAQSIAYSLDHGSTWTKYPGNPVIPLPPAPHQDQFTNFRDPKVFWYAPEKKWVMVVALSALQEIVLYSSPNLRDWTYMSEFGPANAIAGVWECPDLFELPVDDDSRNQKWVMTVNINAGSINGGSGMQYFTGQFDGTNFVADDVIPTTPPSGEVFQDFEGPSYAAIGWKTTGDFVGAAPTMGNGPGQGGVVGYVGSQLLNTFLNLDASMGAITSPGFTISSNYINLLVGGGYHPHNSRTSNAPPPPGVLPFPGAGFDLPAGSPTATYASLGWIATGDLVGQNVATGPLPGQLPVTGFVGTGYANTFVGELLSPPENGDAAQGTLTSPTFIIPKNYINFLIGGGYHPLGIDPNPTAVELLVKGNVVMSATGQNSEALNWTSWNVSAYLGQPAQIRIVDMNTGGWGHITADQFQASDLPALPSPIETTMNLFVDNKLVHSDSGSNSERLWWRNWNVGAHRGHQAYIEAIDDNSSGWGHISADQITFSDYPKSTAHWVDFGSDYYAGNSWNDIPDGKRIGLGWMSNWNYTGSTPTSSWRNAQTFAREFHLRRIGGEVRLVQEPVEVFVTASTVRPV